MPQLNAGYSKLPSLVSQSNYLTISHIYLILLIGYSIIIYLTQCQEFFPRCFSLQRCTQVSFSHADVDECKGSHLCTDQCINALGSYYCSCSDGFELGEDGQTCFGIYNNSLCSILGKP